MRGADIVFRRERRKERRAAHSSQDMRTNEDHWVKSGKTKVNGRNRPPCCAFFHSSDRDSRRPPQVS